MRHEKAFTLGQCVSVLVRVCMYLKYGFRIYFIKVEAEH